MKSTIHKFMSSTLNCMSKKQIILGSFLALAGFANAQNTVPNGSGTGDVGIGTISPADNLHIISTTGGGGGGATLQHSGPWAAVLRFKTQRNFPDSSADYALFGSGANNPMGAGHLAVYDYNRSKYPFLLEGITGNLGIGTTAPDARVHASLDVTPLSIPIIYRGMKSDVQSIATIPSGGGSFHTLIGVEGIATGINSEAWSTGVHGVSQDAGQNIGGDFLATGNVSGCINNHYGVRAEANVNGSTNYGIWASASNACNVNYAGWFNGNVIKTGSDNFTSDRKLKTDIKPLDNSLEKIKLLNPCSYIFKKDEEFKNLNLPQGKQMGLIAQELAEVFPELVNENPANKRENNKGELVEYTPSFKSVQYVSLIPVLISGIKEQQQLIENQNKKIADLEEKINVLSENKTNNATSINQLNSAADGFSLDQNIPNPFSQETVINYILPQQIKNASLIVYDLSGKQLTSFPLELNAKSITITSDKLSAGIYIYSVMADGKIMDSKRMVVADKQ